MTRLPLTSAFRLALVVVAAHEVGVDAEGEGGMGVAGLNHRGDRVLPAGDQDRSERVAKLVVGESFASGRQNARPCPLRGSENDLATVQGE